MKQTRFHYSEEVDKAIAKNRPILALESTIIAHGMPYPQNVETARILMDLARSHNVTPAIISVIKGRLCIGMTDQQLDSFGKAEGVMKLSRRDLPFAVAQKRTGATTVASTMIIAEMAGIRVFATGGIGGVHRGWQESFDISADLRELSKTSIAVVSSGAKAILDLKATAEYLETEGVPVIGFRTDTFPAFYSRSSGIGLHQRAETAKEIADIISSKWSMGLEGGVLIANPIPFEDEVPYSEMEKAIHEAITKANQNGIHGKELTPFLLKEVVSITFGKSLDANISLVQNNVSLGSKIALELHQMGK